MPFPTFRALATSALLIATPVLAQQAPMTDQQKTAIQEIVKEYLLKNPEVIQEAMVELDRRQKDAERQSRLKIISDKNSPLYTGANTVSFGNPKGDVTIVEFFDYNCGFCKRGFADLQKLIGEDKNLRLITKDFPVLGPESIEASRVAMAARIQLSPEKMWSFHQKLITARGRIGKQAALDAAKDAGADMAKLNRDIEAPVVSASLQENIQLGDQLGFTGTPSYVIGDDAVIGAVGYEELKQRISNVRKCGKAAC